MYIYMYIHCGRKVSGQGHMVYIEKILYKTLIIMRNIDKFCRFTINSYKNYKHHKL